MVLAEQARLFAAAGYPTAVVVGREGESQSGLPDSTQVILIPEIDSELEENLAVTDELMKEKVTDRFTALQTQIQEALGAVLSPEDVVIAHNVLTMHFNLALVAAVHALKDAGQIQHVIVWCHDITRYVNPHSGAEQRTGGPWELLRRYRPDFQYVAVSSRRQQLLAEILKCDPTAIQVIPNGLQPEVLLGLSELGQHLADDLDWLNLDLMILMPIRITKIKNIEFAMQVTARLKSAGLRPRLVITGPPDPHATDAADYFGSLQALRQQLQLDKEVRFIWEGTARYPSPLILESITVAELYRLCDLVLMPSLREGFGIPVLEAGLVARPIFATAIPIVDELQPGFDYLIESGESPESVATRIQTWAAEDATHRLRRRVRSQYTWPSIFARSLEPLIQKVRQVPQGQPS